MKTAKSIQKYQNRLVGLIDLANIAIKEDLVKEIGFQVLKGCYNKKSISGNGAYTFMCELMKKCKKHQDKEVVWLLNECMPNMHPLAMEGIIQERIYMHFRHFRSQEINQCLHNVVKKWKKLGKIREGFKPF